MRQVTIATIVMALSSAAGFAAQGPQGFTIYDKPQDVPNVRFVTEDGTRREILDDFQGRTVLLNVWATWCPPCVEEMPTLDALQDELGGPGFEVVAVSVDRGGPEVVRRFFDRIGIENLDLYVDKTALTMTALRAVGLPATLLIDEDGKEIGRLIGPAEWDDPEMVEFLRGYVE